ncbi:N-acetylmuramoyl-L-alanine amidase [Paenibacillus humicus]|uniref:N-acetylmuramoyl-L-alanine amidase n=1 Tax=Paenibacillus humicus TaxID=412861 RepID=UPI003F1765AB
MIDMKWMGDRVPNHGPRTRNGKQYAPLVIVNHISMGTMDSMDAWFRNPIAQVSSHFGIGRDGGIHQYVRLERAAWTQGLLSDAIPKAAAGIVRQMGMNPNLYCVSIEHEGYAGNGADGSITEEQFWRLCWLHKYIQLEVERIWGNRIVFSPETVLGHFQIDPIRKPFCPGPAFPWGRLYAELAIAERIKTLELYEERIAYQLSQASRYAAAFAIAGRVRDLAERLSDKTWGAAAETKLLYLAPVMPSIAYGDGPVTAAGIASRILQLGQTAMGAGSWQEEAVRKLLLLEPIMKERGVI